MAWSRKCAWCDTVITDKNAYGCPCCGSYVCKECWGPDGKECIYCYERHEYLDDESCQEDEDCDCDDCDDEDCDCDDEDDWDDEDDR